MTQTQRNEAIKKLIEERTKKTTASRKIARDTLINEGVYTKKGDLRVEYGGGTKKKAPSAA